MSRHRLILALPLGAVLVAGCGGSSGAHIGTTAPRHPHPKPGPPQRTATLSAAARAASERYSAHGAGAARGPGTVQISLGTKTSHPTTARATVGQVIVWTNAGRSARKIRISATSAGTFTSEALRPGSAYTYRPTLTGVLHWTTTGTRRLTGTITIVATSKDGRDASHTPAVTRSRRHSGA